MKQACANNEPTSHPFASPSSHEGKALFTRLTPEATGLVVDNHYDDDEMWGKRYRAFMGGSMGSGIAVGDFDGDGNVDLYVSTKTKPGRLFRNLGNWKFQDVTEEAGLAENTSLFSRMSGAVSGNKSPIWRQGAVFVDVNNDSLPDLFVCRNQAPNLLYINQGNGTFSEEAEKRGLGIIDGSVIGAFADYDRDGWLDVLILTNQQDGTEPTGRPDRLFHNTGNGYFEEVTKSSGITSNTFGHSADWFDYDEDGWPDLYVANDFAGPDALYRNNHDGTFSNVLNTAVPHTPYSSMGSDTGDVNNDGHQDLMVADMATTSREKNQRGLAASRGDIIQAANRDGVVPQYMRNALLLNTGRGVFQEAACWAGVEATDWTWSLLFQDFDNDGWLDLHVTNGMVREANNSDLLYSMMGALSDSERIAVMKRSPLLSEPNLAFRNKSGEGFEAVSAAWGLDETGITFGAAAADFDNDGDLDLVTLNYDSGLSIFRNDVVGNHRIQVRLKGNPSNRFGVGATVSLESSQGTQSRTLTVARGYCSGSELVAHFGLGADTSAKSLRVVWPSGNVQSFSQLPADRAYTIIEESVSTKSAASVQTTLFEEVAVDQAKQLADRSAPAVPDTEQAFLPFRTDRRGPCLAEGDLLGDGRMMVFEGATTGSPSRMLRWQDGHLIAENIRGIESHSTVEDGPAVFFDSTGDGTQDLLITKASADASAWPGGYVPILYKNDGYGHFAATSNIPAVPINAGAACVADIDGDGALDLFIGGRSLPGKYPESPDSHLFRNDHGRLIDITEHSPELRQVGLVTSALFRDVDGDGRPDLILALEWDYVRYFHNDGLGVFSDWTERSGFKSGGKGWWNSLASADLNGDGLPDFVAGNLGFNTPYRASPEAPATLLYGDFAQKGSKLLVEAVHDTGKLFPLRSKADLSKQLPALVRRFPKTDVFAQTDLTGVFGAAFVTKAKFFEADNFASGVFLSQPNGRYVFKPFPRTAQIGPMNGVVVRDLDGDGFPDVCAVQNSDTSVPRFDGGVGIFLKGTGNGEFQALSPDKSGVVLPGNGRALLTVALGPVAAPGLLATRHAGPLGILQNRNTLDSRWFQVQLRGLAGNPTAIGAKVEVHYSSLPTYMVEVGAGGSCLSAEGPVLFVAEPKNSTLSELMVHWPDGLTTRHSPPSSEGVWLVKHPKIP